MYKSFRVKNFRCFKDLQINDLGRVNLIAGKNNTGKTALMEAMYLLTKPMTATVLLDLQASRGLEPPVVSGANYNRQFFYRYDPNEHILFQSEGNDASDQARILKIFELKNTAGNSQIFNDHRLDLMSDGLEKVAAARRVDQIDSCLYLDFRNGSGESYSLALFLDRPANSQRELEAPSNFIPVQGRPDNETAVENFSNLDRAGRLSILQDTLMYFEDELSDLRLSQPYGELLICGRVNGYLIPLKLMGEGVNRTCHVLLTMMSNAKSLLFIDEIENGIHHSVQCKVWKAIGRVARELDIQVFATTHSYEMIEAAHEAFRDDDPYEFRFHRLNRNSETGQIEAVTYNKAGVNAFTNINYEVRG